MENKIEQILKKIKNIKFLPVSAQYLIDGSIVSKAYRNNSTEKNKEILENHLNYLQERYEKELIFSTIINEENQNIEYTFIFNKNGITIQNNLTKEFIHTNYSVDICFYIFTNVFYYNNNSIFLDKNKDGLNILNIIFSYNNSDELLNRILDTINKNFDKNLEDIFSSIVESGNIKMFKHFILNHILDKIDDKNLMCAACFSGNPEIIHILEQKGFDKNININSALKAACISKNPKIVIYLLDKYNINDKNIIIKLFKTINDPITAQNLIHYKLKDNFNATTIKKIKKKCIKEKQFDKTKTSSSYKIISKKDMSLLHYAVKNKNINTINFLTLHPQIEIYETNLEGKTVFDIALEKNDTEICEILIKNTINKIDYKIFNYAITKGNIEIVRTFINNWEKFKINEDFPNKNKILEYAISKKIPGTIQVLLEYPDIYLTNSEKSNDIKQKIFTIAVNKKNNRIIELLLNHPNIEITNNDIESFKMLCNNNEQILHLLNNYKNCNINDYIGATNNFENREKMLYCNQK